MLMYLVQPSFMDVDTLSVDGIMETGGTGGGGTPGDGVSPGIAVGNGVVCDGGVGVVTGDAFDAVGCGLSATQLVSSRADSVSQVIGCLSFIPFPCADYGVTTISNGQESQPEKLPQA